MEPLTESDPKTVGDWSLICRLGSGDTDVVYLAETTTPDVSVSRVALRVVSVYDLDNPELHPLFNGELGALERVDGPNLARFMGAEVRESDADADQAWVASEFIEGPTLSSVVEEGGLLATVAWFGLAAGLLSALQSVHRAGFTHGDIKPANILLSPLGPVLIDFGISDAIATFSMTMAGERTDHPTWLSPEQATGTGLDLPSDIFSAGAVLAYAATGRVPWGPLSTPRSVVVQRICEEEPDLGGITASQLALISRMMDKDPADRLTVEQALTILSGGEVPLTYRGEPIPLPASQVSKVPVGPSNQRFDQFVDRLAGISRRNLIAASVGAIAVILMVVIGLILSSRGAVDSTVAAPENGVTASPAIPKPPSESSTVETPSASPTPTVLPVYAVKVNYANDNIPDTEFSDTLDWTFDICLSDKQMLESSTRSKVALYLKMNGSWVKQASTSKAVVGGRCTQSGQVNVTLDATAQTPDDGALGNGWSTCLDYRVVIPETSRYRKSYLDACVQTNAM